MTVKRVTRIQDMRGNPKCPGCGADVKELFRQGKAVYGRKSGPRNLKYYCAKCRANIFGGVRRREDEK